MTNEVDAKGGFIVTEDNAQNGPSDNVVRMSKIGKISGERRKALAAERGPREEDEVSRWTQLLDGTLDVEDLDDEELTRMRTRDRLGGFTGRPSKNIPRKLEAAMRAEFLKRQGRALEDALPIAVKALSDVALKGIGKDRIAAAALIMERGLGKVADKVDITQHSADPWETITAGIISESNMEKMKEAIGE